jgi:hypothetical protein
MGSHRRAGMYQQLSPWIVAEMSSCHLIHLFWEWPSPPEAVIPMQSIFSAHLDIVVLSDTAMEGKGCVKFSSTEESQLELSASRLSKALSR